MKKNWILFCFFVATVGMLSAQRHETLLGRSSLNGAFGAPIYEFGLRSDGVQGAVGGGGGLVFHNFFLGAYGVGAAEGLNDLLSVETLDGFTLAHGGLWLGLTPGSYRVIHPYFSGRLGWGVLDLEFDNPSQQFEDLDQVFVITPEAGLEVNIARWFRINGTVGYRFVNGINETTPVGLEDQVEGLIGAVTLRFGWFGNPRYQRYHSNWNSHGQAAPAVPSSNQEWWQW